MCTYTSAKLKDFRRKGHQERFAEIPGTRSLEEGEKRESVV